MEQNIHEDYTFQNLQDLKMTFTQVFNNIKNFMEENPNGNFKLMIGTDSQVHKNKTVFISGIVIQNKGKGVWACIRKVIIPRRMIHLHERISFELSLTEEIVSLFSEDIKKQLIQIVLPYIYHGAAFTMEGHIDIGVGNRNKTSAFVKEMVSRMESTGVEPKIKPNAFVASSYANRYTR